MANAAFIGNVAPILAVIGGALFFGERPPVRVWPALALALVGSWVMAGMTALDRIGWGDAFALNAAAAYATYLMFIKTVRSGLDGPTATLWSAAVSAVALTFAALLHGEKMIPSTALGWTIVVLLGVVSHAMGQGFTSGRDRPGPGGPGRSRPSRGAAIFRAARVERARRGDDAATDGRRRNHPGGGFSGAAGLSERPRPVRLSNT